MVYLVLVLSFLSKVLLFLLMGLLLLGLMYCWMMFERSLVKVFGRLITGGYSVRNLSVVMYVSLCLVFFVILMIFIVIMFFKIMLKMFCCILFMLFIMFDGSCLMYNVDVNTIKYLLNLGVWLVC